LHGTGSNVIGTETIAICAVGSTEDHVWRSVQVSLDTCFLYRAAVLERQSSAEIFIPNVNNIGASPVSRRKKGSCEKGGFFQLDGNGGAIW